MNSFLEAFFMKYNGAYLALTTTPLYKTPRSCTVAALSFNSLRLISLPYPVDKNGRDPKSTT
jgi:hypothetical protein